MSCVTGRKARGNVFVSEARIFLSVVSRNGRFIERGTLSVAITKSNRLSEGLLRD